MAKRMTAGERELDILAFLHRNYLMFEQWVTIGDYARYAQLTRSPYLTSVFHGMLDANIIEFQQEPYRATVKYTFRPDYRKIEQYRPHLKTALIERVGAWQESLL